jgi:hypothetical protein
VAALAIMFRITETNQVFRRRFATVCESLYMRILQLNLSLWLTAYGTRVWLSVESASCDSLRFFSLSLEKIKLIYDIGIVLA